MTFPSFAEFLDGLVGHTSYPWQDDLATRACAGDWPDAIDVPTGLGKTSAATVGVYALAKQAHEILAGEREDRTTPMRIVHVVNRRTVIDQTYDGLHRLGTLSVNPDSALQPVRDALVHLAGPWVAPGVDGAPVVVGRIHGESRDAREWLRPTGATVVTMTPHQLVSRLAFRGLGVTARARSIHAGLLGVDTLILFDEPQLSPQAVSTVRQMLDHQAGATADIGVPASRMVLLGATIDAGAAGSNAGSGSIVRLTPADRDADSVSDRLDAARPVRLVSVASASDNAVATALAKAYATERTTKPAGRRIAVIANTIAMAQQVAGLIRVHDSTAVLVTSRMRRSDRDRAVRRIIGADEDVPAETVVATQCLEVGVDVSFDSVITEAAPYPTLVQRLGRLNRDGKAVAPQSVLVLGKGAGTIRQGTVAVYGSEPVRVTNDFLRGLAVGDAVDLSLKRQLDLRESPGAVPDGMWPEPPRLATFHSGYLGVMATTYPTPWSDLPLDSFIAGPDEPASLDVLVAWRDELELVKSCPPLSGEQVAVPLPAVRAMLAGHTVTDVSDVDSTAQPPDRTPDGVASPVVVQRDDEWKTVAARDLRPGDVVVLDSSAGGYRDGEGWSPSSRHPVSDRSLIVALSAGGPRRVPFPVSHQTLLPWLREHDPEGFDSKSRHPLLERLKQLLEQGPDAIGDVSAELSEVAPADLDIVNWEFAIADERLIAWRSASGSPDAGRDRGVHQELSRHQKQVRDVVSLACDVVGAESGVKSSLATAAEIHDEGKSVASFQAYLGNLNPDAPWAKSKRGKTSLAVERRLAEAVGHSLGWRHEGRSAHVAAEHALPDLIVHLAGSHHGRFRPLLASAIGGDDQSELPGRAASFEQLNRVWGPWGLAYLEAVLRLSDWLASAHPKSFPKSAAEPEPEPERVRRARRDVMTPVGGVGVALPGLVPTPLTGWFALAGLLRCAHDAGDETAAVCWPKGTAGWPGPPMWQSALSLTEVSGLVLNNSQWRHLELLGQLLDGGLTRKHQKVGPASRLRELLIDDEDAWLVRGLLQDAAGREAARDVVPLSVAAVANNASYVRTAVSALQSTDAEMMAASLVDPLQGWLEDKCDGGMDRPGVDDGVTGREVKDHRMIRKRLAPAALLGMASMGAAGLDGLGVNRRELRLPLPSEFVTWPDLVALTHAVAGTCGSTLRYTIRTLGYEKLWLDGTVERRARRND